MAQTASTMLALGTQAPDFSLPDADGKIWRLSDLANQKPLLVIFLCNHCPYVIHIREKLAEVTGRFMTRGVAVVGINANDAARYPLDNPEKMKEESLLAGYAFPYLYDESQTVAQTYQAACTPDFFLFDRHHQLVYRGQFDGSRPKNAEPVTGKDLITALEAVLIDAPQVTDQFPSLGCNIKWKEGNEPDYF
ncbi:thioredoxin family protein [Ferrovum myxofaciens]|uniref:Putative peroxiredoxin n=1 Tax=Ferrovum myxofaciens TaxID=416213 RepID=A0A8F3E3H6_9PROT|nr:thioredoxin family protein [Ferrovum myxofaciens]KXW57799.1 putative peroxiredoxin [Ferrovum myxofaciens]QKE39294.1 MAG: thioredoxin family protein [Ferrovum myxofaciens]QWY74556.1 MAG: thioredoxin family protein [Ferrovum myxofaciens]QWY77305.1 MAG: thioredoxin family protein [Ferrovum myxofaciens]